MELNTQQSCRSWTFSTLSKHTAFIAGITLLTTSAITMACGPTPQKVVKQIEINAAPNQVWQQLRDFSSIAAWHADVANATTFQPLPEVTDSNSTIEKSMGENSIVDKATAQPIAQINTNQTINEAAIARNISLNNHQTLIEKLGHTNDADMRIDYVMIGGDFPVSNYRGVMQVKPSSDGQKSIVTWSARFNNKANALAAPAGADNETAIAAVEHLYDDGLQSLKQRLEHTP